MAAKEAKFRGHLHFPTRIGEAGFFDPDALAQYHANNQHDLSLLKNPRERDPSKWET